jgi:hypothetical protein
MVILAMAVPRVLVIEILIVVIIVILVVVMVFVGPFSSCATGFLLLLL